jgi:hypothetical protein
MRPFESLLRLLPTPAAVPVPTIKRIELAPELAFLFRLGAPIFRPPIKHRLAALAHYLLVPPFRLHASSNRALLSLRA